MDGLVNSSQFTVGEWTVEPGLGRIRRGGVSTDLEPRILDLLIYLAEHAGETVGTDELAQSVWLGRAVTDQPVYQGIAQLRKALGDRARRPRYIVTITKKGYRLIAPVKVGTPDLPDGRRRRRPRYLTPTLSTLLAAVALLLGGSDVLGSRERPAALPYAFESIAVLPFEDMTAGRDQQHLGDGIAEQLIHTIGLIPDVRVLGRTSSFALRERALDAQQLGRSLNAEAILEGSLRRAGDRWRIAVRLLDASDGYPVWSQTYQPQAADVFHIQDQIAGDVARFLQTGIELDAVPVQSWTPNPVAAEAYYLGVHEMHKRRADSLNRALVHLRRAVAEDPAFALAYTALAEAYFLASDARYGNVPDAFAMQSAKEALAAASSLDPELPGVLVLSAGYLDDDEGSARSHALTRRALEINPSFVAAYKQHANQLENAGRRDEALDYRRKAVELDPLSPVLRIHLAATSWRHGHLAEAEAQYRAAIDLDPKWHAPYTWLAVLLDRTGRLALAIDVGRKAVSVEGASARWAGQAALGVGYRYLTLENFSEAERWFLKGQELGQDGWFLANHRMHLYLAQDRLDRADALLTQWATDAPELAEVFSLGGLYRSMMGQSERAVAMFEHAQTLPSKHGRSNLYHRDFLSWGYVPAVHLARLYLIRGAQDSADRLLVETEQYIPDDIDMSPGPLYVRASIHALRGEERKALETLDAAVTAGWMRRWFTLRDPIFSGYQGRPKFEAILQRVAHRLEAERQSLTRLAAVEMEHAR